MLLRDGGIDSHERGLTYIGSVVGDSAPRPAGRRSCVTATTRSRCWSATPRSP
ncbi:hypothetical protein G7085_09305 [Tessaracoccus sp. HDW20]|uniref:hypothetical protein n=1 Tax=Tessaracoccus coleopterorum TaxID=2714950 RepID=UPI0018D352A2|nr:hypothetical protein [Tessaracoccus coleopterorum]NHB84740.1 hypothetical protein [Tessaracoccus coleopterorum]